MTSVSIAVLGVALVPVFASFNSIYAAHGAFTAGGDTADGRSAALRGVLASLHSDRGGR